MNGSDLRQTLTIDEAVRLLGISRNSGYEAVRRGDFPVKVIRVGSRILVPRAALEELLNASSR